VAELNTPKENDMLFAMQMWSRNGKTTVSQQNWKNGFRKHSRFLLGALVVPTLIFTGCMTHPGDGYVVGDNDWVFNRVEVDRADERHDGELAPAEYKRSYINDNYLPLDFVGHTKKSHERITLQAWVPDESVVSQRNLYRDPGKRGIHISGKWSTIGTTFTSCRETMSGWYTWNIHVEFKPEGDDWDNTFDWDAGNHRDRTFRFDFRALGADGKTLYCWKEGFSQYFDFGSDPIEQYPAHMADIPEKMSVYFQRFAP